MRYKFKSEVMERDGEIEMSKDAKIAYIVNTLPDYIIVGYFEEATVDDRSA